VFLELFYVFLELSNMYHKRKTTNQPNENTAEEMDGTAVSITLKTCWGSLRFFGVLGFVFYRRQAAGQVGI
jgi:hypothetical protein